ncbi:MAG: hypothetical protein U1A78_37925 [Polyangia bacterium]
MRTPVGLYYTKSVHDRNVRRQFGYTSIVLDYPNADDEIGVSKPALASRCVGPGAYIAIHGGAPGRTRGCIRLLDDIPPPNQVHHVSIRKLANLIRSLPERRAPVISVDESAAGCYPAVGAMVSPGCAQALRQIVDNRTRPHRSLVLKWMNEADAAWATEAKQQAPLPLVDAWATSEARVCGPSATEPCRARSMLDGDVATMWCGGAHGQLEWLAVRLAQPGVVKRLAIRNGSWWQGREALYGRLQQIEVRFAGQSIVCKSASEGTTELSCPLAGGTGDALLIRLLKVAPGSQFAETCITDLMLFENG